MSSDEKKLEIKRLVIFLILATAPICILAFSLWEYYGEPVFSGSERMAVTTQVIGLGMYFPALAVLITRLITKEGFKDTYLAINFKGNAKYYAASVWIKLIEGIFGAVMTVLVYCGGIKLTDAFTLGEDGTNIALTLLNLATTLVIFFPAFGEEWGWRGYMMPKLLKLMPKPAAIIVGGVIWGLWHAPFTVQGHNFGLGYIGYPWLGIALMCVDCVVTNALLTYLTERTKSIYPACFCHYVNNCLSAVFFVNIFGTPALGDSLNITNSLNMDFPFTIFISPIVVGIITFILFIRKPKDKGSESEKSA